MSHPPNRDSRSEGTFGPHFAQTLFLSIVAQLSLALDPDEFCKVPKTPGIFMSFGHLALDAAI